MGSYLLEGEAPRYLGFLSPDLDLVRLRLRVLDLPDQKELHLQLHVNATKRMGVQNPFTCDNPDSWNHSGNLASVRAETGRGLDPANGDHRTGNMMTCCNVLTLFLDLDQGT